jgi:hypothetical protein
MKCVHCRVDFCWACMRLRTNCRPYQCINGAPFQNAVPNEGNGGDQRDDSILTVIDYLVDRQYPRIHYYDGLVLFGCLVLRNWAPLVDIGGTAGQLVIFLFFKGLPFVVALVMVLSVEWERLTTPTQPQYHNAQEGPNQQDLASLVFPPDNNLRGIGRLEQVLEQQLIGQAIRRSMEEQ